MKIKKPFSSEMCPTGYHVVKGHARVCHSGTRTWVDTHARRNRGQNPTILLKENIQYLNWNSGKKYPRLGKIAGFEEHPELDSIIQLWIDHWKNQGLPFPDVDPLIIKALIAIESSFNPKAQPNSKTSTACGLTQLTNQARRILNGIPDKSGYREMKSNYIQVSRADLEDPVVAVAAGLRWLAHKYAQIPSGKRSIASLLRSYHSRDKQGEQYARKVEELYQKSKSK